MTDDAYTAGLLEIRKIRDRLAELERVAAQGPSPNLESLLGDRYAPFIAAPADPRRKALENAARGFVPDPATEAGIAARAKDPAAYDAEMRRVGVSNGLETALYDRQREAAIAVGAFVPSTEGETS